MDSCYLGGRVRRGPSVHGDRGAAAVEFALVSVLLLTLLFGIIQYSYFFFQSQGASATSREAARLAAVGVSSCSAFEDAVVQRANANGTTIPTPPPNSPDIDLFVVKDSGNTSSSAEIGDVAKVTVTWRPQRFGFPFVPFLSGNQDSAAQTRVENVGTMTGLSC